MTSKVTGRRWLIIAAILAVVLMCAVAAGTYYSVGSALRCKIPGRGQAEPGMSARTIVSGGIKRCYFLYTPPNYDPETPTPVVFSFHGFLSNPNSHAMITGWHNLAKEEGFLVVYPEGTNFPKRWNAGATWGDTEIDDTQFFLDVLEDVSGIASVDPARVYVNGFSNGGGMSVRIGCDATGRVAAFGSVAGAVVDMDNCNPSRPAPMMAFHGTSDPVVNYDGLGMQYRLLRTGAGLTNAPTYFVGAENWIAMWADFNGCDPAPEPIPQQGDVYGVHYAHCDEDTSVILYTVEGGGHTWPGGMPLIITGKTTKDIDATREMWEFFQGYSLEDVP